jgi:hypothetical protein
VILLLAGGLPACSSSAGPPRTEVVVGVQSDTSIGGALGSFHIVTTVNGAILDDDVVGPSGMPYEAHASPPSINTAATVAVHVEGYPQSGWTPQSTDAALLVRTAETQFIPGKVELLRVLLQADCLLPLPGGPPGAPVCTAPQTCVGGACQADAIAPQSLEPYTSDWPATAPDLCKPLGAGPPIVQVGSGQTDYLPVTPGQTVQMEQGPQGGHHIWIAVRQENLLRSGTTTTITSVDPANGLVGPQTSYIFTFDPDEGGFCKLSGLRYQLDIDGADYHQFLGQPIDVTVTLHDASGTTGTGVAHLNIAPQLLCPTDVPGCP